MGKTDGGKAESMEAVQSIDFLIKPEASTPQLDASKWPILLRNYDRLNVRR